MPFVNSPVTQDTLTADGDTNGYVTVAANDNYYPGAKVWLADNGTAGNAEFVVTDLKGSTKIGLRKLPTFGVNAQGPQYGRSDVSAWTVANGTTISQRATVVRVELSNITKVPLI